MVYEVLTIVSTGLSTVAVVLALAALRVRTLPRRRIERCELRCDDLDTRTSQLFTAQRRMQARMAARIRREKADGGHKDGDPLPHAQDGPEWAQRPDETRDEWKARLRAEIHAGRLKPHG